MRIAIALASCEPNAGRLEVQLASIRDQTHRDWVCVISDDGSGPEGVRAIEAAVAGDPRFELIRHPDRLGFYRNFERAIATACERGELVALCDQDDRWDPDKLEALAAALAAEPGASLAYSDFRLVSEQGAVIADSFWTDRRNRCDSVISMLVANTVTGAASLIDSGLARDALPFPELPGPAYHDHWLAMCALASGEIAYLDRVTYDRLEHPRSVTATQRAQLADGVSAADAYALHYRREALMASELLGRFGARMPARRRRALERFCAAETSWTATAWLALRALRPLLGRDETLGIERRLVRGILWRRRQRS